MSKTYNVHIIMILIIIHSCVSQNQEIIRDDNGTIILKCELRNNLRHGRCYHYCPNGTIKVISNWNKGVRNGESIEYYENGNVHSTTMWKDGNQDGKRIEYYENGNIKKTSIWKDNKANGECDEYYENGNIKEISYFKDDQPIEREYYDQNAELQKVNYYIIINNKSKLNGIVMYDVDDLLNKPYNINVQKSLYVEILADENIVDNDGFTEYKVIWMCDDQYYVNAITGKFDHNFNIVDSASLIPVNLANKNRFYLTNHKTDTLRIIFDFIKKEDGEYFIFQSYLEKNFTVIEK